MARGASARARGHSRAGRVRHTHTAVKRGRPERPTIDLSAARTAVLQQGVMKTPPAPDSVRKVAIVGTGVIGSGWAAVFLAKQRFEVCAFVRSEASENKFHRFLQKAWKNICARGLASDAEGWRRVKCVRNLAECVSSADYVQESVVESLILKQDILQQIDEHAPPGVIIGTSSSFIPATLCAAGHVQPHRIATVHPTLPQYDAFVEVYGVTSAVTNYLVDFFGPQHIDMDAWSCSAKTMGTCSTRHKRMLHYLYDARQ